MTTILQVIAGIDVGVDLYNEYVDLCVDGQSVELSRAQLEAVYAHAMGCWDYKKRIPNIPQPDEPDDISPAQPCREGAPVPLIVRFLPYRPPTYGPMPHTPETQGNQP